MKAKKQEFEKKWVGLVEIKTGDSIAKVTSVHKLKDGKIKVLPNGEDFIKIAISDLPKASLRVIKPKMDSKRFRVRFNIDGDKIETVTPVSGDFRAKLVGLGPKTKDGEFKLIPKVFNEGTEKENRHSEFIAIYEIIDGVFRGVELPGYYLHYKFEEDETNEGFTQYNTADTPQAAQLHKLQNWAAVHGNILDEDIRWPDDEMILPELEERALDADREVNLHFKDGYIDDVQAVEDYESVDVEDMDEEETDKAVDELDIEEVQETVPARAKKAPKSSATKKHTTKRSEEVDDDL